MALGSIIFGAIKFFTRQLKTDWGFSHCYFLFNWLLKSWCNEENFPGGWFDYMNLSHLGLNGVLLSSPDMVMQITKEKPVN